MGTGSVAVDHIMVFRGRFRDLILPDKIHMLNVAFHVPALRKSYGGTAANIAFNLRQLGEDRGEDRHPGVIRRGRE